MNQDIFKVILIGDTYVGKTTIINKYVTNSINKHIVPTIGFDFRVKTFSGTSKIKLRIWDTAGQERYRSISKLYYKNTHAIFLVFDITNLKSFENINYWYNSAIENGAIDSIFYLVGSKADQHKNRKVSHDQIHDYANTHNMKYFEISVFENYKKINDMFSCIIGDIICNSTQNSITNKPMSIKLINTNNKQQKKCCVI